MTDIAPSPSQLNGVIAFIGLGANLNDPRQQLLTALESLAQLPNTRLVTHSSLYRSVPMGPQDQDDYINAVAKLETQLAPLPLLDALQSIENRQGRVRKEERWGPRTLDLDLLLYNNSEIDHPRLTVPHYGIAARNFVLLPLAEIAPQLVFPDGTRLPLLIEQLDQQGIEKL